MSSPLFWLDRDLDGSENRIRADVREAAKRKWPQLLALGKRRLGNREQEIQELFERAVTKVSKYLEDIKAPPQDPSGLLVVSFRQALHSFARRIERTVPSGNSTDMEAMLPPSDWEQEANRNIFLEELVRHLKTENRAILRLRSAGYDWAEIAAMLKTNSSSLRNRFWRDVRKAYLTLIGTPLPKAEDNE